MTRAPAIAAASPRLDALILGYADLAAALGRTRGRSGRSRRLASAQEALLVAARACGLQAIDGPYLGHRADAALPGGGPPRARARLRRQVGGAPAQVAELNATSRRRETSSRTRAG